MPYFHRTSRVCAAATLHIALSAGESKSRRPEIRVALISSVLCGGDREAIPQDTPAKSRAILRIGFEISLRNPEAETYLRREIDRKAASAAARTARRPSVANGMLEVSSKLLSLLSLLSQPRKKSLCSLFFAEIED